MRRSIATSLEATTWHYNCTDEWMQIMLKAARLYGDTAVETDEEGSTGRSKTYPGSLTDWDGLRHIQSRMIKRVPDVLLPSFRAMGVKIPTGCTQSPDIQPVRVLKSQTLKCLTDSTQAT